MAVLLDTAEIPRAERADAVVTTIVSATVPSHVALEEPQDGVHAFMELWELGNVVVFRTESSGIQMTHTPRQARQDAAPVVALAIQELGDGRQTQFGPRQEIVQGELMMMDLSAPYDFSWSGEGASRCVQIPVEALGLPVDVIRKAGARLSASPLYPLVRSHIADLTRNPEELSKDPAAAQLGAASVELARALLASAAGDAGPANSVNARSLLTRIRAYTRQHLADPALRPDTIAAEHNISVRYLYKLCADADFSLEQWIISQRLEGARAELARASSRNRSVAVIARRWGFRDPTHFSRRFRTAYGISPRDWQRVAAEEL
jgi:AraC-like DNA-binding protein